MQNWKTTLFGALAIVFAVGGGIMAHYGYTVNQSVVDALVGLLLGSGLLVAKDAHPQ